MLKPGAVAAVTLCLAMTGAAVTVSTQASPPPESRLPTIYVLQDSGTITIFHGSRQTEISGPHTGMHSTVALARQALGDLVVSNREVDGRPGSIVTLPAGEGDVQAKYILKCKGMTPWGIGLDADSNIWMTDYESDDVREYAATADGCPKPLAIISGAHTGLDLPENVAIDRNGRIVVADYLNGVRIFAPSANGDVAPVATLTNAQVMNAHLEGMAIDRKNNIWVTSYADNAVLEFAAGANGDAAPKRVISGDKTLLSAPVGIALDRRTGEIYVAAYGARAVLVFSADADGNVAPVRQFATGSFPFGVAVK